MIVLLTRGDNATPVALGGLVSHQPTTLKVLAGGTVHSRLLDVLWRLGWDVAVRRQRHPGNYSAILADAVEIADEPHVIMDDDVIPVGDIGSLLDALDATVRPWSCPVVRFVQGFDDPPPGHTEIWHPVDPADGRVQAAKRRRGWGWQRVYDTGLPYRATDQLPGAMFAVDPERVPDGVCDGLRTWRPGVGGADQYLGVMLGLGTVTNAVVAYHWGHWSPSKWEQDDLPHHLLIHDPDTYAHLATTPHDR